MFTAIFVALGSGLAVPGPADFIAVSPAAERPVGRIAKLAADGTVELETITGRVVVHDFVSLRRATVPLPAFPRGPVLLTTASDRIPGQALGGDGDSIRFEPAGTKQEWTVPLSAAAVVWAVRPPAEMPADPSRYPWLAAGRNRDVFRFRGGDVLTGTLDGFAVEPLGVRFRPEVGGMRTEPFAGLAAIAFNPKLASTRRPKGSYLRLVLRDGTRLHVTNAAADADTLHAKTLFGQETAIRIANIVSIDVVQGKAMLLADLKPKSAEHAGFLGTAWPWVADRNVRGAPMRLVTSLGEETFDRGLGTHPRTVLSYDLGGKYRRFEALVGLDADSGPRGHAVVRVLVDGKERAIPGLAALAAGSAVPVMVDVSGAKELKLSVDFGPLGDVQADVNWADARLME